MAVIDASNAVLGRLCSVVAKRLLLGEKIVLVNAEKAVISGTRQGVFPKYRARVDRHAKGNPLKGPHYSRMPDRIVRKAVQDMLPKHTERGRKAFRELSVFIGVPGQYKGKELEKVKEAEKKSDSGFVFVEELSKYLGAKW